MSLNGTNRQFEIIDVYTKAVSDCLCLAYLLAVLTGWIWQKCGPMPWPHVLPTGFFNISILNFGSRDVANRENEYYESDSLDSEKFFNQAQQRAGKPMAALQAQGKDSAGGGTAMPPSLAASGGGSVTGKQRKRLNIALLRRGGLKGNSNYSSSGTLMNQV